jgi:ribosomal protein S18 acetylase RimI-like enzyme
MSTAGHYGLRRPRRAPHRPIGARCECQLAYTAAHRRPAIVAAVPEITLRPILPPEFAALGDLTVAAYRAVPGGSTSAGYEETLRDVAARAGEAEVLVAVDADGTLLGGITYVPGPGAYAEFHGADEAGIRMLAVAPAAQGRGVGTRLMTDCIERATAAGKARIVLHTTASMTAAQALYGSLGFERTPDRDLRPSPRTHLLAYVLELTPAR